MVKVSRNIVTTQLQLCLLAAFRPDRGKVVRPEVILASRDRIALDAVGVAILRLYGTTPQVSEGRVFEQAQIARAVELELGARRPQDVRLLTGDDASEEFWRRSDL